MLDLSLVIAAYLLGSISSAIIVCRLMGLPDPRTQGSNNPGATNVLRTGSKWLAAATLLLDLAKGLLPALLAKQLFPEAVGWAALFAVIGHCFPVWLGFKGGKGVATNAGVCFGLAWQLGLVYADSI